MTDTKPKPLTPKQRQRKAKDLLRRHDELKGEAFALLRELDMAGPDGVEISDALYHSRDGFWLLERAAERVKQ